MTGMRCTLVDDCDRAATLVIGGGPVVLLCCDEHGRPLLDASDHRGQISIRTLRPRPVHPGRNAA